MSATALCFVVRRLSIEYSHNMDRKNEDFFNHFKILEIVDWHLDRSLHPKTEVLTDEQRMDGCRNAMATIGNLTFIKPVPLFVYFARHLLVLVLNFTRDYLIC